MLKIRVLLIFLLLLSLLSFVFGSFFHIRHSLDSSLLEEKTLMLKTILQSLPVSTAPDARKKHIKPDLRITLIKKDGFASYDSVYLDQAENYLYSEEVRTGTSYREEKKLARHYIYAVKPLEDGFLRAGIEHNQQWARALIKETARNFVISGLILLLIGIIILENIFGPIRQIIRFSRSFARGNYKSRIRYTGTGELELVARNLNDMALALQQNHNEIHKKQQLIETAVKEFPLGIALLDEDGRVDLFNPKLEILLNNPLSVGRYYYE